MSDLPILPEQTRETQTKPIDYENANEVESKKLDLADTKNEDIRCSVECFNLDTKTAEELDLLRNEIKSLREQNEHLRSSLEKTNLARDDVVEKMKDVSIETRKLIENCERTTEECKMFKARNEILEEELRKMKDQNESLLAEKKIWHDNAEILRKQLEVINVDGWQCEVPEVRHVNQVSGRVLPLIGDAVEELRRSNRRRKELEQELIVLQNYNDNLLRQIEEKNDDIAKQNVDFQNIKKSVNDYRVEIARLDAELKECHAKVSTLDEALNMISRQNVDINLAEFTSFKNKLKNFDLNQVFSRLHTLDEIESLFDEDVVTDQVNNDDRTNEIKYRVQNLLKECNKLNEKNIRLVSDYDNKIQAKNDEIASLKEILHHAHSYTDILEQTLNQCQDNANIGRFVEEKTSELIAANKALLETFKELKEIYYVSRRYNDVLFVKFRQLHLCFKIVKIHFGKLLKAEVDENSAISIQQQHERCDSLLYLMGELFEEIDDKNVHFEQIKIDAFRIFGDYEANIVSKDYLKDTVDAMKLEVKHLTNKVTLEMAEKIRQIELLRSEMDATKTTNQELVNKVKNCNREIISLSSENYDLSEKLEILSSKQLQVEVTDTIRKIHLQCTTLRVEHTQTKRDIIAFKQSGDAIFTQFTDCLRYLRSLPATSEAHKLSALCAVRDKCREFKRENQILREDTLLLTELMFKEITCLKNYVDRLVADIGSLEHRNSSNLKASLMSLHAVSKDLKKQCNQMKDLDLAKVMNDMLEGANATLMNKFNDFALIYETMERNLNVSITNENSCKNLIASHAGSLLKIVEDLKTLHKIFSSYVKTLPIELSNCIALLLQNIQETTSATFDHMKASLIRSHEEAIEEMQQMNSELKKRGETISALNKNVDELMKEKENFRELLALREKDLHDLRIEIAKYDSMLVQKNSLNDALSEELHLLKEQLQKKNAEVSSMSSDMVKLDAEIRNKEETIAHLENEIRNSRDMQDGDVSSMGNISRTEEVSRLKDVEDSFEERYLKLRCVAIKMKKNIAELNLQLKTEKAERAAIQGKLNAAVEQAKQSQALQEECDKVTDDLELKSKEIKELKKIILEIDKQSDKMKLEIANLNEKIDLLSEANDALKTENNELCVKMKDLNFQLNDLEKEKFVEETLKKEKDKEIQQLKQKIKENEELIRKIQVSLEQAKLEARKQGALNLEMRDYEKTISDLSKKLEEQECIVKEFDEKLKASTESNVALIERIKQLEEQITSYGVSNKAADEQILNLNLLVSEHEKNLELKEAIIKRLTQQLEEEKSKKEEFVLQLASTVAEVNVLKELLDTKEQSAINELKSSQHKINSLEEKVKKKENEFDKLKEDFESYKIRAHNVLQKLKSESNSKNNEEKFQNEIVSLTKTVQELRKRLDDTIDELHKQRTELKLVDEVKEKLQLRIKEMNETLAEKNKQLDNIRVELKSRELNHKTRVKYYEDEIDELRAICEKYKTEIEELRMLEKSQNVEKNDSFIQTIEHNDVKPFEQNNDHQHTQEDVQDCDSRHRKENMGGRKKSQTHSLIPLDKLLETDIFEEKRGNAAEMEKTIKLLESQVNYLNGILNESEKNAARNEQQVALLKDEIRRLQKTIERAPHLQNGEYLKNVLFNFFTFPDGEEKCRLITILGTLLQLTAEETETLSAIAKGYRVEQKRTSGSGLSSMLRLW